VEFEEAGRKRYILCQISKHVICVSCEDVSKDFFRKKHKSPHNHHPPETKICFFVTANTSWAFFSQPWENKPSF